jgi:hypothetical protein
VGLETFTNCNSEIGENAMKNNLWLSNIILSLLAVVINIIFFGGYSSNDFRWLKTINVYSISVVCFAISLIIGFLFAIKHEKGHILILIARINFVLSAILSLFLVFMVIFFILTGGT